MGDDIFNVASLVPLRLFFSLTSVISMTMVYYSRHGLLFQCVASTVLLFNIYFLWCKHTFSVFYISHLKDAEWSLIGGDKSVVARICSGSVVTRYLSVLYFVDECGKRHAVILIGGVFESYYQRRLRFIVRTQ